MNEATNNSKWLLAVVITDRVVTVAINRKLLINKSISFTTSSFFFNQNSIFFDIFLDNLESFCQMDYYNKVYIYIFCVC